MKKSDKEEKPVPFWKRHIPKFPECKQWKRDSDGFPIFYDGENCQLCKGKAKAFSHPWYAFKYQLLGYCEPCVLKQMGPAPTKEEEREEEEKDRKKAAPAFRFVDPAPSPDAAVDQLRQLALAL
jgi:hypothetical protein